MEIIQRLPLTLTAWVSFGTFTLASIGVRALINLYYSRKRSRVDVEIISAEIPDDMWNEIFKHGLTDAPSEELLELSLVSKLWNKKINDIYTRRLLQDPASLPKFNKFLTPKRYYYYLFGNRQNDMNISNNSTDPLPGKEFKISYGPWLDHNVLRHPENFWLFMKAMIFNPSWLPAWLIRYNIRDGLTIVPPNHRRVLKYVTLCSILLSYLPYMDSVIYRFRTTIPEPALATVTSLFGYLWSNEPMNFLMQLRLISQLVIFQLFDNAFFNNDVGALTRLGLLVPFMIVNGGFKRFLIFAAIFAVCFGIRKFKEKFRASDAIAAGILFVAALMLYFIPAIFVAIGGAIALMNVVRQVQRDRNPSVGWMKFAGAILFTAVSYTLAMIFLP